MTSKEKLKVKDELIKQYRWERDVAISQLAEIGKGFGAKMDDVRDAIKRREPKKPIVEQDENFILWEKSWCITYSCPVCNRYVNLYDRKFEYCPNCGQAIDWEIENDN